MPRGAAIFSSAGTSPSIDAVNRSVWPESSSDEYTPGSAASHWIDAESSLLRSNRIGRMTRALSVCDAAMRLPFSDSSVLYGSSDARPDVLMSVNTMKLFTFAPFATACTTDAASAIP